MSRSSLLFALPLALATLGCGAALSPPFTPPEHGGPAWTEISSDHFVFRSDLPADEAHEMLVELERIYVTFEDIAFPFEEKPKTRTGVVVFRDQAEYDQIAPPNTGGFYRYGIDTSDGDVPSLFLYGELTNASRATLQHELTHRFVHFYFPGSPRWLNEGLAQYYSTMAVEDGKVVLGRDLPNRMFRPGLSWSFRQTPMGLQAFIPISQVPRARDLLNTTQFDFKSRAVESEAEKLDESKRVLANYAGAWALVHLLKNGPEGYHPRFESFIRAIGAGKSTAQAWSENFRDIPIEKLEDNFQAFLKRKETTLLQSPYEPRDGWIEYQREMTPDAVHLLWATMRTWNKSNMDRVYTDIQAARALAPSNAKAKLWAARLARAQGAFSDAEKTLSALLQADPDNEVYLRELFNLYQRMAEAMPEEKRSYERVEEILPKLLAHAKSASSLNALAWYMAEHDRADEGFPLAKRAVNADFGCFECIDTLALLHFQKGEFEKAFLTQTVAVNMMPDNYSGEGMMDRWTRFRIAYLKDKIAKSRKSASPPASPAPPEETKEKTKEETKEETK